MTNPATRTAFGTMLLAAVETNFPPGRSFTRDALAASVLPLRMRMVAAATRVGWIRGRMLGRIERDHPGTWAGIACRKTFIDEQLGAALDQGVGAVVDLGAGLDTRAYRIPGCARAPFFEVDLPENIGHKRAWIARTLGDTPAHVRLVPVDFDREDLGEALAASGLPTTAPSFVIWEGVTQYLSEAGVRATLAGLGRLPAGSRLVFTYVREDFVAGREMHGLPGVYRRLVVDEGLWHFGLAPEAVDEFVGAYGWRVVEHVGAPEFMARYVAPTGRAMTVMAIERLVVAEKL